MKMTEIAALKTETKAKSLFFSTDRFPGLLKKIPPGPLICVFVFQPKGGVAIRFFNDSMIQ